MASVFMTNLAAFLSKMDLITDEGEIAKERTGSRRMLFCEKLFLTGAEGMNGHQYPETSSKPGSGSPGAETLILSKKRTSTNDVPFL